MPLVELGKVSQALWSETAPSDTSFMWMRIIDPGNEDVVIPYRFRNGKWSQFSSTFWSDAVSSVLSAPPGSPAIGQRHIVGASPTGSWAGQTDKIATWTAAGWDFYTPDIGQAINVINQQAIFSWYGTWVAAVGGSVQSLAQVLAIGNDANNVAINNLGLGAGNNSAMRRGDIFAATFSDPAWITGLAASKLIGTIPLANIPAAAIERVHVYAGAETLPENAGLTISNVQNGDIVKMNSTGFMYAVVNDAALNQAASFTPYFAGAAATVPWSGVTGTPTTLAGYGVQMNSGYVLGRVEAGVGPVAEILVQNGFELVSPNVMRWGGTLNNNVTLRGSVNHYSINFGVTSGDEINQFDVIANNNIRLTLGDNSRFFQITNVGGPVVAKLKFADGQAAGDMCYFEGNSVMSRVPKPSSAGYFLSHNLTSPVWGTVLQPAAGGTGRTDYTIGDMLYASGTTTLTTLAAVAAGNVLLSNGVAAGPVWGKVNLTTHTTGALPISAMPNGVWELVPTGGSYSVSNADNHKIKVFTDACTVTLPLGLDVGLSVGFYRAGTGLVTWNSSGTYEGAGNQLSVQFTAAVISVRDTNIHVGWGAVVAGGGGGISNTAAANEIAMSNGTNLIGSGIFRINPQNYHLGSISISGDRYLNVESSTANASLNFNAQGSGSIQAFLNTGAFFNVRNNSDAIVFQVGEAGGMTLTNPGLSKFQVFSGGNALLYGYTAVTNTTQNYLMSFVNFSSGSRAVNFGYRIEYGLDAGGGVYNSFFTNEIKLTSIGTPNEAQSNIGTTPAAGTMAESEVMISFNSRFKNIGLFTNLTDFASGSKVLLWKNASTIPSGTVPAGYGVLYSDPADSKLKWKVGTTIYDLTGGGAEGGIGPQDMWIPAGWFKPTRVAGCGILETQDYSGGVNVDVMFFSNTVQQFAQWKTVMPRNWNNGVVTAKIYWLAPSGIIGSGVVWSVNIGAYSNDDSFTTGLGSGVSVTDTLLGLSDQHTTPETLPITVGNSPQDEDFIVVQVTRIPGGLDTLAAPVGLIGMRLTVTTNASTAL